MHRKTVRFNGALLAIAGFVMAGCEAPRVTEREFADPGPFIEDLQVDERAYAKTDYADLANSVVQKGLEKTRLGDVRQAWTPDGKMVFQMRPLRTRAVSDYRYCRVYEFRAIARGWTGAYRGGACRDIDGQWSPADISLEAPRRTVESSQPLPWRNGSP